MKNKLKIALIGYGKMGKEIDALCRNSDDYEVVSVSYREKDDSLDIAGISKADVAIDFTSKDVVIKNIEEVAKLGVNLVVGTTGWSHDLDKVEALVKKHKIGFLHSPNFSVGANIFFKMVDFSAKLFSKFPDYDAYGLEIHHKAKLDAPSGTALKIASKVPGLSGTQFHFSESGQESWFP
jgi:4-hydroxy-tetrahydrodipicolinate reductase